MCNYYLLLHAFLYFSNNPEWPGLNFLNQREGIEYGQKGKKALVASFWSTVSCPGSMVESLGAFKAVPGPRKSESQGGFWDLCTAP